MKETAAAIGPATGQSEDVQARSPAIGWRPWYMLAIFCLLYIVSVIDRNLLSMSVPHIKRDLHLSDLQVSFIIGPAFVIFYSIGGLPFGAMADRYPRRIVAWIGVTIWSVSAVCCGLAQNYGSLLLARMGVGGGESALTPAAYSAISDAFPRSRLTLASSLYAAAATLGGALALLLGGLLLDMGERMHDHIWPFLGTLRDWQFAFIVTGLPGLLLGLLAFSFREPARRGRALPQERAQWRPLIDFIRTRRQLFSCLFAGFGFAGILVYGLISWTPTYLSRHFHLTPTEIGSMYGAVSLVCGILSHTLKGIFVDWLMGRGIRDAHFRIYIWCAIVSGPIGVLTYLTDDVTLFFIGLVFVLMLLIPFLGYASAALQLVTPNELRGKMAGIFLLVISGVGFALGPTVVALLTDAVFDDEAMLGAAIATLIVLCVVPATIILATGCKHLRAAMAEADSWH